MRRVLGDRVGGFKVFARELGGGEEAGSALYGGRVGEVLGAALHDGHDGAVGEVADAHGEAEHERWEADVLEVEHAGQRGAQEPADNEPQKQGTQDLELPHLRLGLAVCPQISSDDLPNVGHNSCHVSCSHNSLTKMCNHCILSQQQQQHTHVHTKERRRRRREK